MAVITHQCTICKRTVNLPQNKRGLETLGRCIITHGCRGVLYQIEVHLDFIRGKFPKDVVGLENWRQRSILYTHTQTVERSEWVIDHNLGTVPIVQVFVNRPIEGDPKHQQSIIPTNIEFLTDNTILLTFDRRWSGVAQLIALAADPDILTPRVRPEPVKQIQQQLTNQGELTIATQLATIGDIPAITLNLIYSTAAGIPVELTYVADDVPTLLSPWRDINRVMVGGKVYIIRSFNIRTIETLNGTITNGSSVQISTINYSTGIRSVERGEILILLAHSPFDLFDKIRTKFIDITSNNTLVTKFDLFYNNGELFAFDRLEQITYPPIKTI